MGLGLGLGIPSQVGARVRHPLLGLGIPSEVRVHLPSPNPNRKPLLSQYLEDFSSYTLKMFITDYHTLVHNRLPAEERLRLSKLQGRFSLIKVKVLLLSLLVGCT